MSNQNFTVYRSAAGSGKTFTLTKEYLKILLACPLTPDDFNPRYFQHILAVTFTNDAANEMKERILGVITAWAKGEWVDGKAKIDDGTATAMLSVVLQAEELPKEYPSVQWSEKLVLERAALIHRSLLHNYTDFAVSTIDSFTNRIVQAFKQDLGFPYSHEIELDTAELQEETALALQRQLREGGEEALNRLLVEFAVKKSDEGKSWFIHRDLESFAYNLFQEERSEVLDRLKKLTPADFQQIKEELYRYTAEVENKVQKAAGEALTLIKEHDIDPKGFHYGSKGIYSFFVKHAQGQEFLYDIQPNSYARKTIDEGKWTAKVDKKKNNEEDIRAIEHIKPFLYAFYEEIQSIKEAEQSKYVLAHELRGNIYLLSTINALAEQLALVKESKRVLHISEFNRSINAIVEEEPVPYIYERIGDRYYHLLIDEFQDTSRMQWHNLIPLVANALGFGCKNLVVGDAKQAIYRWRGGNADMLVNLPQVTTASEVSALQEQVPILDSQYDPRDLDTNYRSLQEIIHFNNHFFSSLAEHFQEAYPELPRYYAQVSQKALDHKTGGHVEFRMLKKQGKGIFKQSHYLPLQQAETLKLLQELKEEGNAWSDIAILVRKNAHAKQLASHLQDAGIPIVSEDSLLVSSASVVDLMVKAFKVLQQPSVGQWRLELLLALQQHWSRIFPDQAWEQLFEGEEGVAYLQRSVHKDTGLEEYGRVLSEALKLSLSLTPLRLQPIYELCETLIRHFHLDKVEHEQPYLHSFLDFVLESTGRRGNDLDQFLGYWERKSNKLAVQLAGGKDAVRIMTVHRSKGLQFPIVVVPFLDWSATPHNGEMLWLPFDSEGSGLPNIPAVALKISDKLKYSPFAKEYREAVEASFIDSFNLLYVAFTRAESQLYGLGKVGKPWDGNADKGCSDMASVMMSYFGLLGKSEPDSCHDSSVVLESGEEVIEEMQVWTLSSGEKPLAVVKEKGEELLQTPLQSLHTAHWQSLKISQERLGKHDPTLEDIEKRQQAQEFGNTMHAAFELVGSIGDIPKAVQRIMQRGGIGTAKEAKEMEEAMKKVAELPEIAQYYAEGHSYRVLNEQEILLPPNERGQGQSARPDRMQIQGSEAVIIDYKTGASSEDHKYQVKKYMGYMKYMGFRKVKGFVVYTDPAGVAVVD